MLRYADTCVLLSLVFRDAGTPAALTWLEAAGEQPIVASHWSLAEFASAAGIMARRGDLSAELHRDGLAGFRRLVAARLRTEAPAVADFERASIWMEDFRSGLRAGDALHLAICARLGATLCTADDLLAGAAARYGIGLVKLA